MSNKKLLLALTLSLAACSTKQKTVVQAHDKYLACYALDPAAKKQCTQDLQFDSERQEFKRFINDAGLPCEHINEGPEFTEEKQAYLVRCEPNHQYFMRFNYDTKEWKLIEEHRQ
jgi:hypothetical protein